MVSLYILVGASIFMHMALGGFICYICIKNISKRDKRFLQNSAAFYDAKPKKVYTYVAQTGGEEQLYGYQVHCQIGTVLVSNN